MEETFIKKVIAVQSRLKAPKSQYNKFGQYPYRSCEDILEAVKPLLKEQGLILMVSDAIELIGSRFYVKATARLTDGTDYIENQAFAREDEVQKGMVGSMITGATSSFARKYALNGLLCIDDNKDADSQKPATKQDAPQLTEEDAKALLSEALKALSEIKSQPELKAVCEKYKPTLGKNVEFIKAVNASPYCPAKKTKK